MIEIQSPQKFNADDPIEERPRIKSISQHPPSYIDLFLNNDQLTTTDPAQGHILISLAESYEAKKLTLSILGELVSQTGPTAKKQSTFKRLKTSITGKQTKLQRTFTTAKDPSLPNPGNPGKNRRGTRTLTRTFTMVNRIAPMTFPTQNEASKSPEMKNRELFCHYNIPLFTFKTTMIPAGTYRLPFNFTFPSKMLPTAEYNNSDQNFKFSVNYKIIAELEENVEEPEDFDDKFDFIPNNNLKSSKDIKIYKALRDQPLPVDPELPMVTEVSGKLKLPTLLCCANNSIKINLKLQNTTFMLGEKLMYQLESHSKVLKPKKTKVAVSIVQELNTFGNKRDVSRTELNNSNMLWAQDRSSEVIMNGGSVIVGEVELPKSMEVTFRSPNVDIAHYLEIILSYKSGMRNNAISLRAVIVLKKDLMQEKEIYRPHSVFQKFVETEYSEDQDVMVLPLAKFKLDEKFNLLTKTAEMFNEMNAL